MVSFFFSADLAMLSEAERCIIDIVCRREHATCEAIEAELALGSSLLHGGLQRLECLGFIERDGDGGYSLVNEFFARWFSELSSRPASVRVSVGEMSAVRTAPLPQSQARRQIDGRYELLSQLGRGSSGEVYLASDSMLQTEVAIKLLRREYSADEEAVERLRREVVLARDLSHSNLLKIYHLGDDGGRKYVTMQYVDGPDLAQVIAEHGGLQIGRAVDIAGKLAAGLAALHRRGVLHRDIKPSNVLLDGEGEPRISDFGLARLQMAPGITQNGMFLGTPAYASPEQVLGEPLDPRSDLYALGIVIFQMVTGRLPFEADSVREQLVMRLEQAPPDPAQLCNAIPRDLSELIVRCLAREPERRFQSAGELERCLSALPSAAPVCA